VGYVPPTAADPTIWEQHEIEMALAPLPDAADHVVLTQWVLRNLARAEGLHVRFDPILRRGHAGSGLHVHLAPMRDGRSRAAREGGRLADEGRWLVAGLVRHGVALLSMGNRVEDSFVRLQQGKESPTAVAWGDADRSALVRLPIAARTADGREVSPPTVEFRLPDGSAHPHLLLAGVAQVFLAGRAEPDLDAFLAATSSVRVREDPAAAAPLPRNRAQAAAATAARRGVLEAGGVFPAVWLDRLAQGPRPSRPKARGPAGRSPRRGTARP
jgi:glutamine synthetase